MAGRKNQESQRGFADRSQRNSGGYSPRSQTLIKELKALLASYNYGEADIIALVKRCNYDPTMIQAAVSTIMDENDEPDWATTATASEKKARSQEAKERRLQKEKAQAEELERLREQRTKDYDERQRRLKQEAERRKLEGDAVRLRRVAEAGAAATGAAGRPASNAWKRAAAAADAAASCLPGRQDAGETAEVEIDVSCGEDDDDEGEEEEEEEEEQEAEETKETWSLPGTVPAQQPPQQQQVTSIAPLPLPPRAPGDDDGLLDGSPLVTMPPSYAALIAAFGEREVKFGSFTGLDNEGAGVRAASSTQPAEAAQAGTWGAEDEEGEDAEAVEAQAEHTRSGRSGGGASWGRFPRSGKGKGRGKGWDGAYDGGDDGKGEGKRESYKGKKGSGRGGKKGGYGKTWRETGKDYRGGK